MLLHSTIINFFVCSMCRCGNVNWARRNTCNVCNAPKFGIAEARTGKFECVENMWEYSVLCPFVVEFSLDNKINLKVLYW